MTTSEPDAEKPLELTLHPIVVTELGNALRRGDTRAAFSIIGDFMQYNDLTMPREAVEDYRERNLLEEGKASTKA